MILWLLRHGETQENVAEVIQGQTCGSLNSKGRRQAKLAAEKLSVEKFDIIFSSDLLRVRETLKAVIVFHPMAPVLFSMDLRERSVGVYEGRAGRDLYQAQMESGVPRLEYRPPGGESALDVKVRTDRFLKKLLENYSGKSVLLCTHGGPIRTILAAVLETPLGEIWDQAIDNTSLSTVEFGPDGRALRCTINSTAHLSGAFD